MSLLCLIDEHVRKRVRKCACMPPLSCTRALKSIHILNINMCVYIYIYIHTYIMHDRHNQCHHGSLPEQYRLTARVMPHTYTTSYFLCSRKA